MAKAPEGLSALTQYPSRTSSTDWCTASCDQRGKANEDAGLALGGALSHRRRGWLESQHSTTLSVAGLPYTTSLSHIPL